MHMVIKNILGRYRTEKTDLIRRADVCGETIAQLIKQLPYETKEEERQFWLDTKYPDESGDSDR